MALPTDDLDVGRTCHGGWRSLRVDTVLQTLVKTGSMPAVTFCGWKD